MNKITTLLVDTDYACHLFIDGDDKGMQSPEHSQKFKIGPDEHILKCSVEGVPDLVWRKVLDAKGASQVAAVISLKALHIQYDQAVTKLKSQKEETDATASRQLQEAESEQKQREAAKAALPQQVYEIVQGVWHGNLTYNVEGLGMVTDQYEYEFGPIVDGVIQVVRNEHYTQSRMTVVPVAPNLLTSEEGFVLVKFRPDNNHWKKLMDPDGFLTCAQFPDWPSCRWPAARVEISIINRNRLEERAQGSDVPLILTK